MPGPPRSSSVGRRGGRSTDLSGRASRFARLRYTKTRREWALYWRDRNLKFHLYDLAEPTASVETLLDEVDRDPTSIFWG